MGSSAFALKVFYFLLRVVFRLIYIEGNHNFKLAFKIVCVYFVARHFAVLME